LSGQRIVAPALHLIKFIDLSRRESLFTRQSSLGHGKRNYQRSRRVGKIVERRQSESPYAATASPKRSTATGGWATKVEAARHDQPRAVALGRPIEQGLPSSC